MVQEERKCGNFQFDGGGFAMVEEQEHVLRLVFGSSSESDKEDDDCISLIADRKPNWEHIQEIAGLWLCTDFLSLDQQSSLLSSIKSEGWFTEVSHNQAMRFGNLPKWAIELASLIHEAARSCLNPREEEQHPLPSSLLWREPLFDQLIVNVYNPGEGICSHVDLLRFDDGIAIVSLESPCVMHFTRVAEEAGVDEISGRDEEAQPVTKVPVLLLPGSLVLMSGDARYLWKHEINRKPSFQVWEGREIEQKRRTSVTLRKLCQSI